MPKPEPVEFKLTYYELSYSPYSGMYKKPYKAIVTWEAEAVASSGDKPRHSEYKYFDTFDEANDWIKGQQV